MRKNRENKALKQKTKTKTQYVRKEKEKERKRKRRSKEKDINFFFVLHTFYLLGIGMSSTIRSITALPKHISTQQQQQQLTSASALQWYGDDKEKLFQSISASASASLYSFDDGTS